MKSWLHLPQLAYCLQVYTLSGAVSEQPLPPQPALQSWQDKQQKPFMKSASHLPQPAYCLHVDLLSGAISEQLAPQVSAGAGLPPKISTLVQM